MDDSVKSLYEQEIQLQREQIQQLKQQVKNRDETNSSLIDKVRSLQDLIEKAHIANKDLHSAFEHVRQENIKLQRDANESAQPEALPERSWNEDPHVVNRSRPAIRARPNITNDSDENMALETVQQQYVNLAQESVSWLSNKDRLCQRIKFLERECERYNRDNETLGLQVRHLLRTLEEERGMIIRRANQASNHQQLTTAIDVIDKHLVTFESIEQLQQQNQKLLSLVKDLSQKDEELTLQAENEDIKKLNAELAELRSHLENVKSDRERIMNAFNTIMKERDLFKILLCKTRQAEHMTPEIFQRMVSIACASGPAIESRTDDSPDKDAHIIDLKSMISKLEQELSDSRADMETLRQRSSDEIKLKSDLLEQARCKIIGETQKAESLQERCELLETNIKSIEAEFDEMRTRCQKLTFELDNLRSAAANAPDKDAHITDLKSWISKLEQELSELRAELGTLRQRSSDEIKLKSDMLEQARYKIIEETHKAKLLQGRCELLETNIKSIETELDVMKTRCQELINSKPAVSVPDTEVIRFFQDQRNIERDSHLKLRSKYRKLLREREYHHEKITEQVIAQTIEKVIEQGANENQPAEIVETQSAEQGENQPAEHVEMETQSAEQGENQSAEQGAEQASQRVITEVKRPIILKRRNLV